MTTYETRALEALAAFEAGDWGLGMSMLALLRESLTARTDEVRLGEARDVVVHDYSETVRGVAVEVATEWQNGDFNGSRETLFENLEQSCDTRCTYTVDCQYYLTASSNSDAYVDEFGPLQSDDIPWSAMAACAMRRDVIEMLDHVHDIDVNKPVPREPVVMCCSCTEWAPGKGDVCNDCYDEENPGETEDAEDDSEEPSESSERGTDRPGGDADG